MTTKYHFTLALQLCEEIAAVAWPIILERFEPDCCVAATAIAIDVCRAFRQKAFARPCRVVAYNRPMAEYLETHEFPESREESLRLHHDTGAWILGIGFGTSFPASLDQPFGYVVGERGPKYNGHLVAIVENGVLLDLSIPQASRPQYGMDFTCCAAGVPPQFGQGTESVALTSGGNVVQYRPEKDRSYRDARDWTDASRRAPVVRGILAALKERIQQ